MSSHAALLGLVAVALLVLPAAALPPLVSPPSVRIALQQVVSGLPMALLATHAGDGSGRLFIVQQAGLVRSMKGGVLDPAAYLDVRSKVTLDPVSENGLLGLAFHPRFEGNGQLFISYIGVNGSSVLERLTVAEPANGRPSPNGDVLLAIPQAYCSHKGGGVAFGPDGYLYWGLGDGGCQPSPPTFPQDPHSLFGKMLRLDVDVPRGYAIPPTNPYAGGGGRGEIWASGLRNPWRWSFDRATGDLWIADVGQYAWEEVNRQPALSLGGANYGWRWWQGTHEQTQGASTAGMTFPVLEYSHDTGCSVTGGYVYRGAAVPDLGGVYLFGDFCYGQVWGARGLGFPTDLPRLPVGVPGQDPKRLQSGGFYASAQLLDTDLLISSFGEDEAGEVYAVNYGGSVHRLVAG